MTDAADAQAEYEAACASLRAYREERRYSGVEYSQRLDRYQAARRRLLEVGGPWLTK